ncbi:hypothetical protein BURMUCGD2_4086 [Burkholderia multivorans CGD2]|uniref:Uncharacterized protein n=1 Tax=Burkholderia multivorans CGD2 TaxID=513052 RepID=B9BRR9_9BURK|nr:hypothetical protein BURMUCGD2_4086 [Burkholderia multivorans CGD2]
MDEPAAWTRGDTRARGTMRWLAGRGRSESAPTRLAGYG